MSGSGLALLDTPERLATALPELRRRLLERLRVPASATQLAAEFGMPRQRLNYHLHVLQAQDLVELVEIRQRRGFRERMLRTIGDGFVVDPGVMAGTDVAQPAAASGHAPAVDRRAVGEGVLRRDRHAAGHLVQVAGAAVRDVARMSEAAGRRQQRLLTFTLETEVRFASPAHVHDFTAALAAAIAQVAARFDTTDGRPYRMFTAGHPAAVPDGPTDGAVPFAAEPRPDTHADNHSAESTGEHP